MSEAGERWENNTIHHPFCKQEAEKGTEGEKHSTPGRSTSRSQEVRTLPNQSGVYQELSDESLSFLSFLVLICQRFKNISGSQTVFFGVPGFSGDGFAAATATEG